MQRTIQTDGLGQLALIALTFSVTVSALMSETSGICKMADAQ